MKRYLLLLLLALTACSRATWYAPLVLPPDSGNSPPAPLLWGGGKIKATTVIFQAGTGNVATPAESPEAAATPKPPGLPWLVFALVGVLSIAAWEWATARLKVAAWLPWRGRAG